MSSAADLLSQAQKALDSAKAVGAGRSLRGIRISLAISRLYEAQGRSVGNDVLLRKCNESLITAMASHAYIIILTFANQFTQRSLRR